jgi:hypothetical protein
MPRLFGCVDEYAGQRIGVTQILDAERPPRTMVLGRAVLLVLGLDEIGENVTKSLSFFSCAFL